MSKFATVILVCFVMVMFLWLLGLLGATEVAARASPWLAWFACLFLGFAWFLTGTGIVKSSL